MLFRPNFCANCGEKVERSDWGILTSRRFCQVCESEFKGHDLVPRAVIATGVLLGIFGFGSYLNNGTASDARTLRQTAKLVEQPPQIAKAASADPVTSAATALPPVPRVSTTPVLPPTARRESEVAEYFCGAETKKGTPCSRRVKSKTRCFQHAGMPAMAAAATFGGKGTKPPTVN